MAIYSASTYIVRLGTNENKIAGWTIDNDSIFSGTRDISEYSTSGITLYSGGSIHAPNFYIDTSGNAFFKGTLSAPDGNIGGFTIDTSQLHTGTKSTFASTAAGVYVGTDGIALGTDSPFNVNSSGDLVASSATITGDITATNITATTAGNIAGFTISANQLAASSGILNLKANGRITGSAVSFTGGRIAGFDFTSTAFQSRQFDSSGRRAFQLYTGFPTTEAFISGAGDDLVAGGDSSVDAYGIYNDPYNYWQRIAQDFSLFDAQYFRIGDGDEYIFYDNSAGFSVNLDGATLGTLTLDNLSDQGSELTALTINGSNAVGYSELGSNAFTNTNIAVSSYSNATNDRVLTSTGAGGINGESSLSYNGTDLTITNGNVNVSSGYGIDFAATSQASGMTSELLDDYEEGTWTPEVIGLYIGDVTPTAGSTDVLSATYTKIGRSVYIRAYFRTDGITFSTSYTLAVRGLPFTVGSGNAGYSALNVGISSGFSDDRPSSGYTEPGTTRFRLLARNTSDGNTFEMSTSDLSNGTDANTVLISGFYFV
jgi:hypothetical protein